MGQIPSTFAGDSWAQLKAQLFYAVDTATGRVLVSDAQGGEYLPDLTNGQAMALLQAWRKTLRAWKQPMPGALWPALWYLVLGYQVAGDKFDVSIARAQLKAEPAVVAGVWAFIDYATEQLDRTPAAKPRTLGIDFSYSAWDRAARDAYEQLKLERAASKRSSTAAPKKKRKVKVPMPPGIDDPEVELPDEDELPVAPMPPQLPKMSRGTALLIVLILILAAVRQKGS